MSNFKRILSLCLAFIISTSILSLYAFADEFSDAAVINIGDKISMTKQNNSQYITYRISVDSRGMLSLEYDLAGNSDTAIYLIKNSDKALKDQVAISSVQVQSGIIQQGGNGKSYVQIHWDKTTKKSSAVIKYEVEKGTYYIMFRGDALSASVVDGNVIATFSPSASDDISSKDTSSDEVLSLTESVTYDSDVVDTLQPNAHGFVKDWKENIFDKSWFLGDSGLTEEDYITISVKQPYTPKGKLYHSAYIVDIYQEGPVLSSALMNVEIKDGVPIKIKDILSSGGEYTNGKNVDRKYALDEISTMSFTVWDISSSYDEVDFSITLSPADSISVDSGTEAELHSAPTSLKATPKSTTSIKLSWKDNGADSYNIYRSTSKNGTYKKIASTEKNTYTNKKLTKGKTYYYKVTAVVGGEESELSKVSSAKATSPTPSSVKATKVRAGIAHISWKKSTGASGYEVYMATSSDGKYSRVKTVSNNKLSNFAYRKTKLTAGKTYYFKVRSYSLADGKKVYSPFSKVVKVKV